MRREHTGRRRNDAAREDILAAAAALITDPGAGPFTIDEIARRAGVGKQTIYRWWPSKYAVLADAMIERARIDVTAAGDGTLTGDLTTFLTSSFAGAEQPATRSFLRAAMAAAQTDEAARTAMQQFTEQRRAALRELLERHAVRGADLIVEQAYGVLWYRIMVGHEPLTEEAAVRLSHALVRQAEQAPGVPHRA